VNKKRNLIIICSVLSLGIILTILPPTRPFPKMISDIRKTTEPIFDSVNIKIQKENNFENGILLLIKNNNIKLASKIIDSAISNNPTEGRLRVYKGMLYASESKYVAALQEYDSAVFFEKQEFPLVQGKKAEVFVKLHDYANALDNFKKAAEVNHDYYYNVAQTFEAIDKNDSALKYFLMYKQNDTTNKIVSQKIISLSK
jgi:tetratricopeptide (TPR) repeat protein